MRLLRVGPVRSHSARHERRPPEEHPVHSHGRAAESHHRHAEADDTVHRALGEYQDMKTVLSPTRSGDPHGSSGLLFRRDTRDPSAKF